MARSMPTAPVGERVTCCGKPLTITLLVPGIIYCPRCHHGTRIEPRAA